MATEIPAAEGKIRRVSFWGWADEALSCTVAFYSTPRNKEMADKYGIIIGTSHCEPMMRNTYAEWNKTGKGAYDYVHNREEVLNFWEERVHQLAGSDNIYTIGMRGLHDDHSLSWFLIAGPDGKFIPAQAEIKGNKVVVMSINIQNPVAVRFAWNESAIPNFYNKGGLPAVPFRTDK